jgi:hypothetical protein
MEFGDFVQTTAIVDTSGTSTTIGGAGFGSNVTAGNLLVVGGRVGTIGRTITVTSDSTPATFSQRKNQSQDADGHEAFIHDGLNQAGGVKPTITFSISGAAAALRLCIHEFTATPKTAFDVSASAQGSSTTPGSGATAARSQARELQIGFCTVGLTGFMTYTAGTGFTVRTANPNENMLAFESIVRSSTGTEQADFTISVSDAWACLTGTYSDATPPSARFPNRGLRPRAFAPGLAR